VAGQASIRRRLQTLQFQKAVAGEPGRGFWVESSGPVGQDWASLMDRIDNARRTVLIASSWRW